MYKILIEIPFRSGHRLIEPYAGKCNNVHGEGYTAIIEFQADTLDENGMVMDFGEVKSKIKDWINKNWDHAYLHHVNDKVGKMLTKLGMKTYSFGKNNPTAENMAMHLSLIIQSKGYKNVSKVGIVESFRDSIGWYQK